jgi:hypothetical protein
MTQKEQILQLFENGNGSFLLSQAGNLMRELSARISDLRTKHGCKIECIQNYDKPSENEYHLLYAPEKLYKGQFSPLVVKGCKATLPPEIQLKIDGYREIMSHYPVNHIERVKVQAQIDRIIEKGSK